MPVLGQCPQLAWVSKHHWLMQLQRMRPTLPYLFHMSTDPNLPLCPFHPLWACLPHHLSWLKNPWHLLPDPLHLLPLNSSSMLPPWHLAVWFHQTEQAILPPITSLHLKEVCVNHDPPVALYQQLMLPPWQDHNLQHLLDQGQTGVRCLRPHCFLHSVLHLSWYDLPFPSPPTPGCPQPHLPPLCSNSGAYLCNLCNYVAPTLRLPSIYPFYICLICLIPFHWQ